ncbi:M28 family metallopeptidase [Cryobacterium sp. CG_9.6]|uniref:M28 family metallopeptidase n=1 Tax=Cryobacterium sp. CG_9.6 TaxID=2760710 RepID=UPI002474B793|nr:M28 family metallopeptidase [Cryobacterium sp. CG_9.6]MDH6238311.1 hypothetical protein [Cryobacterium sp. CG_9.6]
MYTYVIVPASVDLAAGRSARREPGLKWCRFGDRVIYWTTGVADSAAGRRVRTLGTAEQSSRGLPHLVVQSGNSFRENFPGIRVIVDCGRYLAVELSDDEVLAVSHGSGADYGVEPLPPNVTVVVEARHAGRRARTTDLALTVLADQVSATHLKDSLLTLTTFGTRHSLSEGYRQAGDWVTEVLRTLGYAVTRIAISVGTGSSFSIVADKPGRLGNPQLVLVTAHLDSINHADGPLAPAPGADDNASGSAGVLEIARILADRADDQDLRLVLFGGEEEGLLGSEQYVQGLSQRDRNRLLAVINMDMVGSLNSARPAVLLEGAPVSQGLIDELAASAHDYTTLAVDVSLHPFASDHVPFITAGLPAVLTIEGSDSANHNVHTRDDTLATINYSLLCDIIRMNLVTTAKLIGTKTSINDLERWRQSSMDLD